MQKTNGDNGEEEVSDDEEEGEGGEGGEARGGAIEDEKGVVLVGGCKHAEDQWRQRGGGGKCLRGRKGREGRREEGGRKERRKPAS